MQQPRRMPSGNAAPVLGTAGSLSLWAQQAVPRAPQGLGRAGPVLGGLTQQGCLSAGGWELGWGPACESVQRTVYRGVSGRPRAPVGRAAHSSIWGTAQPPQGTHPLLSRQTGWTVAIPAPEIPCVTWPPAHLHVNPYKSRDPEQRP